MKIIKNFNDYCNEGMTDIWKPKKSENNLTRDGMISIPYFIFKINGCYFGDYEISWSRIDYRMYREYNWDYGTQEIEIINNLTSEKTTATITDGKNGSKLEIENWEEFKTNAEKTYKMWQEYLGLSAYGGRWTDTNYQVLNNTKDNDTKEKIFRKGIEYINKQ